MKCKYCNASVTLEDEYWPYCGALNEPARKHIEDMRRYGRDYERTKAQVYAKARAQSRTHGLIIALVILFVLNLFMFIGQIAAEPVADLIKMKQIHKNMAAYERQLTDLEAAGRYEEMYDLYERLTLQASYKDFKEFSLVADMARNSAEIRDDIYYLTQEDVATYWDKGELIERIANHTVSLYTDMNTDRESSYYEECFTELHLETMANIEEQTRQLLQANCGLLDEDFEKIPDMSRQDLLVLIGRRVGNYE